MSAGRALFLGLDGGGTSTDAWLAAADGPVLGKGSAGPSNAKAVGPARAREALDAAIAGAFADAGLPRAPAEVVCLGLAGFDRPDDRALLERWAGESGWGRRTLPVNDGDLVVAAGTPGGWGVGLIAGTGSIAVGRAPDGRKARAGGWGHLIGDEGSAYALVIDALRVVARRADGREAAAADPDPLTERLCEALGAETPSQIVSKIYAPETDRTRLASLAPVVMGVADLDPAVSGGLIPGAGRALAAMVAAVARSLGLDRSEIPLALAGGFLLSAAPVADALAGALAREGLRVAVNTVPDPAAGALRLARDSGPRSSLGNA